MLSVILASFEQPDALAVCLLGLSCQSIREPFEVIICDDGSTADMLSVVRHWAARGNLDIRLVWQPHYGNRVSRSRNNAVRLARGDLMVFLDGDLFVDPDFLALHTQLHTGADRRLVCGSRRWGYFPQHETLSAMLTSSEEPHSILKALLSGWQPGPFPPEAHWQEQWVRTRSPWMAFIGGNFSVRKAPEVWFDEHFIGWGYEDLEFCFRLLSIDGYQLAYDRTIEPVHMVIGGELPTHNPFVRQQFRHSKRTNRDILKSDIADTIAKSEPRDNVSHVVRNLLYFVNKYPDHDLRPALFLLNRCELDLSSDEWYTVKGCRASRTADEVLASANAWAERQDNLSRCGDQSDR
jgi:glycosyltransferase involved in cell wall biosynthesis